MTSAGLSLKDKFTINDWIITEQRMDHQHMVIVDKIFEKITKSQIIEEITKDHNFLILINNMPFLDRIVFAVSCLPMMVKKAGDKKELIFCCNTLSTKLIASNTAFNTGTKFAIAYVKSEIYNSVKIVNHNNTTDESRELIICSPDVAHILLKNDKLNKYWLYLDGYYTDTCNHNTKILENMPPQTIFSTIYPFSNIGNFARIVDNNKLKYSNLYAGTYEYENYIDDPVSDLKIILDTDPCMYMRDKFKDVDGVCVYDTPDDINLRTQIIHGNLKCIITNKSILDLAVYPNKVNTVYMTEKFIEREGKNTNMLLKIISFFNSSKIYSIADISTDITDTRDIKNKTFLEYRDNIDEENRKHDNEQRYSLRISSKQEYENLRTKHKNDLIPISKIHDMRESWIKVRKRKNVGVASHRSVYRK